MAARLLANQGTIPHLPLQTPFTTHSNDPHMTNPLTGSVKSSDDSKDGDNSNGGDGSSGSLGGGGGSGGGSGGEGVESSVPTLTEAQMARAKV